MMFKIIRLTGATRPMVAGADRSKQRVGVQKRFVGVVIASRWILKFVFEGYTNAIT
jgi:hypothetical protein